MHDRLLSLYRALFQLYGPQGWWPGDGPFEVMVGAVLTQATSWRNVETALANLKSRGPISPEALIEIPEEELAGLIRSARFPREKAQRLLALAGVTVQPGFARLSQLSTAELREKLLAIRGIGQETADSILLYAFGHPVFVVDAYTKRILARVGLLPRPDLPYSQVQVMIMEHLPPDPGLFKEYHALLVRHGKERCRRKPRCAGCSLLCSFRPT